MNEQIDEMELTFETDLWESFINMISELMPVYAKLNKKRNIMLTERNFVQETGSLLFYFVKRLGVLDLLLFLPHLKSKQDYYQKRKLRFVLYTTV